MAFWDWFKSQPQAPPVELPDGIWLSDNGADAGLLDEIKQSQGPETMVLVVAHFPDRLAEVAELLDANGIAFREITSRLRGSLIAQEFNTDGSPTVLLAASDTLIYDLPAVAREAGRKVMILARERHLMGTPDDRIVAFSGSIPLTCQVKFFLSFDDELLRCFVDESVRWILQKMGLKEHESIDSAMVTRRIRAAQRKVEIVAGHNPRPARSARHWIEVNQVPGFERNAR